MERRDETDGDAEWAELERLEMVKTESFSYG